MQRRNTHQVSSYGSIRGYKVTVYGIQNGLQLPMKSDPPQPRSFQVPNPRERFSAHLQLTTSSAMREKVTASHIALPISGHRSWEANRCSTGGSHSTPASVRLVHRSEFSGDLASTNPQDPVRTLVKGAPLSASGLPTKARRPPQQARSGISCQRLPKQPQTDSVQ
jgi:hypothetical protein